MILADPNAAGGIRRAAAELHALFDHQDVMAMIFCRERCRTACAP
jgi:hypothetical protein